VQVQESQPGAGEERSPPHLERRVAQLEQEVQQLRGAVSRTRRLMKQAIMLQMDAEDEEDGL
jgi:uncharacterized protein involved in exopolysaccharide biosynthesis